MRLERRISAPQSHPRPHRAHESDEFIRQSSDYSDKLTADGHEHELLLLAGKNHYTVSRLLSHRGNQLMRQILAMGNL